MEKKGGHREISLVEARLKESFKKIKEEMNLHLDTINETSAEVQQTYDMHEAMEQRMEKLEAKMDEMQLLMKQLFGQLRHDKAQYVLSKYEQKVFMALYTEEEAALSTNDIAIRLNFSELIIKAALISLTKKGIPVMKAQVNNKEYFKLDNGFREMQAKENVLGIEGKRKDKIEKLTSFLS